MRLPQEKKTRATVTSGCPATNYDAGERRSAAPGTILHRVADFDERKKIRVWRKTVVALCRSSAVPWNANSGRFREQAGSIGAVFAFGVNASNMSFPRPPREGVRFSAGLG